MSFNSTSPSTADSNGSSSTTTACDDQTCSTAKCALCLHCSQQYCFVHFLKHNEQLSLNAYNFTLAIDRLDDQVKNLKLDESLRRTIHSLDQWRKHLVRTIEDVYQEKLLSIKTNYVQLSKYLQQFQFEQTAHIQALRVDLEQMKFVRSTYDEEMKKIQGTIKQLQMNLSELQYDLQLKERQAPDIYGSIECEIVWKRDRLEASEVDEDDEVVDYSTTGTPPPSTPSPTSYEPCLLSFLVGNDSLTSTTNKDEKISSSERQKKLVPVKKRMNQTTATVLDSNTKKRRTCTGCGKCYHPSSLQRHYRQCNRQSTLPATDLSESTDENKLKTVTNTLSQSMDLVDA